MSEAKGTYNVGETTHVNAFLSVPGAEVILRSPDDKTMKLEKLIAILSRAAASDENRDVEFWIKLK